MITDPKTQGIESGRCKYEANCDVTISAKMINAEALCVRQKQLFFAAQWLEFRPSDYYPPTF